MNAKLKFSLALLGLISGAATLMGFFRVSHGEPLVRVASILGAVWIGVLVVYLQQRRHAGRFRHARDQKDDMAARKKIFLQEISFYEQKKSDLANRAEQRRLLSRAARELGSSLDPADIQTKLLALAESLFPGKPVGISYGQNNDPVDTYVVQKRQPLLVGPGAIQGPPTIAAPIFSQSTVAGVLRVGGPAPYQREDLRLLDILASLASLALDNSFLFNQIQESALRDGLTGLFTHRAFQEQLEAAILEASRYNQPLSLILTDIDHFKLVNDQHGHQAGDAVLQGFSHVLVRNVRDVDVVGRYGGEEFVLLLLQTPHEAAKETAERIRQDFARQAFEAGKKNFNVTASFGVATFPQDATSGQQLMRQADQHLYAAKRAGRNQVRGAR